MKTLLEFLKIHYQFVLIGVGLIIFISALRNWKWIINPTIGDKTRYAFIFAMWGEKGYRVLIGLLGIVLIICGIVFIICPYPTNLYGY